MLYRLGSGLGLGPVLVLVESSDYRYRTVLIRCLERKVSRTTLPVHALSEHRPVSYQSSLHGVASDSKAAQLSSAPSYYTITDLQSNQSQTRTPIPISATPSTQIFDNTLVELPAVTSRSQRHQLTQDSATTSSRSMQRHFSSYFKNTLT